MNVTNCLTSEVASIGFSPLSSADVRRISVLQVVNPQLLDSLNQPNPKGLYDEHLGPISHKNTCHTCHQGSAFCPGHFGHIELPRPVYHPLFMSHLYVLVRSVCLYCHHFKASRYETAKLCGKLILLDHGLVAEADTLEALVTKYLPKPKSHKDIGTKKSHQTADAEDNMDADEDEEDDSILSVEDFEDKVKLVVSQIVAEKASEQGSAFSRDNYKTGPASDARRALVAQYQKLCVNKKKCENCHAHSNRYRKEQYLRFMELSLTAKQSAHNKALDAYRPSKQLLKQKLARLLAQKEALNKSQETHVDALDSDSEMDGMDEQEHRMREQARREASDSDSEGSDEGAGDDLMDVDKTDHNNNNAEAAGAQEKSKKQSRNANTKQTESILHTDEAQLHLRILFIVEARLCDLVYGPHGTMSTSPANLSGNTSLPAADPDMFFMDVVAVPPSRFRPAATMGEALFENPQNELLSRVLNTTIRIRDRNAELRLLTDKKSQLQDGLTQAVDADPVRVYEQLLVALDDLQNSVNGLIDAGKNSAAPRGQEPPPGVKQVLEKKEGLFRMNMMVRQLPHSRPHPG